MCIDMHVSVRVCVCQSSVQLCDSSAFSFVLVLDSMFAFLLLLCQAFLVPYLIPSFPSLLPVSFTAGNKSRLIMTSNTCEQPVWFLHTHTHTRYINLLKILT